MSSDGDNTSPNFMAMRQRASLLEGAGASAPPPTFMWKPGSQDETAGVFKRALKRIASQWKKRRVTVNPAMFQYEDMDTGKVIGALKTSELDAVRVVNRAVMKEFGSPENLQDFGWILVAGGRQYIFACESVPTRDSWVGYLGNIVKQRIEDIGDLDDDFLSHSPSALSRGYRPSSLDPDFARENNANVAGDVLQANDAVANEISKFRSRQWRKERGGGGSEDGDGDDDNGGDDGAEHDHDEDRDDDLEGHGNNDDDDEYAAAARGGGVVRGGLRKEHFAGFKNAIDDEGNELDPDQQDELDDRSSESEILVERGEELVAATVAELKAPRVDLLQMPGPNKNYRRENIVIEALFEDLRTQEPDHVRLADLEMPQAALSYFQPQLLRAAQDNDLPSDLPPKPLFVSEYLPRADGARPSMRHGTLPATRVQPLVQGLRKLEHGASARAGCVNYVVDSDGIIVGCPSSVPLCDRPLVAISRALLARHAAAKVFSLLQAKMTSAGWRRPSQQQQLAPPPLGSGGPKPQQRSSPTTLAGLGAQQQHAPSSSSSAPPPPPFQQQRSVSFGGAELMGAPANNASSSAKDAPGTPVHTRTGTGGSPTTRSAAGVFPSEPDDTPSKSGGGFGNFINKSIHALRGGSSSTTTHQQQHGTAANLHGSVAVSADQVSRRDTGSNMSFQSERTMREGALPSVYGPVITIETTKRKIVVTDLTYKSDVMEAEEAAPPPLFLCSCLEFPVK